MTKCPAHLPNFASFLIIDTRDITSLESIDSVGNAGQACTNVRSQDRHKTQGSLGVHGYFTCRPAHGRGEVTPGRRPSVSAYCVGVTERSFPWGSSNPTCAESDTRGLRAPKGFGTMHAVSMCVVRSPTTKNYREITQKIKRKGSNRTRYF